MEKEIDVQQIPVGVVGLGLMGCSITACLLIAGHPVKAVAPVAVDMENAGSRIKNHLIKSQQEGMVKNAAETYLANLTISEDYGILKQCRLVIECTLENLEIKKTVYKKIEDVIETDAILTSNTSAIPISVLQNETRYPERFFGLALGRTFAHHTFFRSDMWC